jgi:hypothetical protein
MDARPSEHTSPLGRVMPCVSCAHDEHVLRCQADLGGGVLCPCRDVFVPGIYPAA